MDIRSSSGSLAPSFALVVRGVTRTSQINLLGNVDISEIYVDAERGVVIACVRFMQIADPFEIDYVLHGVWIAHFDTDGSLNRLEDYSDIDYFGGRLPNTAAR